MGLQAQFLVLCWTLLIRVWFLKGRKKSVLQVEIRFIWILLQGDVNQLPFKVGLNYWTLLSSFSYMDVVLGAATCTKLFFKTLVHSRSWVVHRWSGLHFKFFSSAWHLLEICCYVISLNIVRGGAGECSECQDSYGFWVVQCVNQ